MKSSIAFWLAIVTLTCSSHAFGQEVNWRRIDIPNQVFSIAVTASGHVFVNAGDSIYRSTDEGKDWTKLNPGSSTSHQPHNMVTNARGGIFVSSAEGILRSTDGGDSWSMSPQALAPYGIVANSLGYLFTAECFRGVLRSTDNGNSWAQVLDSADIHGIVIGPSGEIIAGLFAGRGPAGGYRSTDNGESWERYGYGFTSLTYDSTHTMFGCTAYPGMWGGTGGDYVLRSTDRGLTWDKVYNQRAYDVRLDTDGRIFAGLVSGGIVISTDNGSSWNEINVGLSGGGSEYLEDLCVYALGMNSKGVVFAGTPDGLFRSVRTTHVDLVSSDFYVHPSGSALNSGLSPSEPIKTIANALSRIYADSLHPRAVHIANGMYGSTETGEGYQIILKDYVTLVGESANGVTLKNVVFHIENKKGVTLENMALVDGAISIFGSCPQLRHLAIKAGGAGTGSGISFNGESNAYLEDVKVTGTTNEAGLLINNSSPRLHNVTVSGNIGWLCGGIRIENNAKPLFVNVTIAENQGGGVFIDDGSKPTLVNSIIWNNSTEILFKDVQDGSIRFANCSVKGGQESVGVRGYIYWLGGNIAADPLFIDAKNGDFRLRKGSPCIDAGTPLFVWQGDTLVKMSPHEYVGSAPDIGAHEYAEITAIQEEKIIPQFVTLNQNYPNPFNPSTTITYELPKAATVSLKIFNTLGQEIAMLVNERKDRGYFQTTWNANVPSGIYFYRLQAGEFVETKKMILLR